MAPLRGLWQGLRRYWRLPAQARADVVRALIALAVARSKLHRIPPIEITQTEGSPLPAPSPPQTEIATRVSIAIQRAARIAPWRSDCLVQALAARGWLANQGVPTRLRLGARHTAPTTRPAMHAWLLCGRMVVTGGDIAQYQPFNPMTDQRF